MKDIRTVITLAGRSTTASVPIAFEVVNKGDKPVDVCIYQTPLEHRISSGLMFHIVDAGGRRLDYVGVQVKRRPPSKGAGDYLTLEPGTSAKARVDLADSYEWRPGSYTITFMGNEFLNKLPSSNTIEIRIGP